MLRKIILPILLVALVSGCGGKTKEELYTEGVQRLKNWNANAAIVLFKKALEKDPNFLDARFQLGKAYLKAGKFEQAEKEFQKVYRQNQSYPDIKLNLALAYNGLNKPDEALKEVQEYLQQKPDSAEALEALGVSYAMKREFDKAEVALLKALQIEPTRADVKLELASIYFYQGKKQEAKALLEEMIKSDQKSDKAYLMLANFEASQGNADKAYELYTKLAEIKKDDPFPAYKAAMIQLQKGEVDKAGKVADELIQKFPKRAEGSRLKGIVLYTKKNFNEAIISLQNANKLQPSIEGYYFLGLSQMNKGELESALSDFRKIIDANPSFVRARLLSAYILLRQKRVDDAITELKKTLEIDDRNAFAHNLLGSALVAKGQVEEGMRELSRATELDPKMVDAHLKKGVINLAKGKSHEAETELTTALQVAPEVLNTRLMLASYYLGQKNSAKAFSALKEGLTGKKADAVLYYNMASIKFREGKSDEGVTYLQKAKEIDPAYFQAYVALANWHASKKDYAKALGEYSAILQQDPKNVGALISSAAFLEIQGKEKEALGFLEKARDTKNPSAYLILASYYLKHKENGKALATLDELLKIDPKNLQAWERKWQIYVSEKKYAEALKVYDKVEEFNQDAATAGRFNTYALMKEYKKAEDQARKVIAKKANSAEGYLVLAALYAQQNNLSKAIEETRNGLRVDPKNPVAYLRLGNFLAAKKDYPGAMQAFQEAVKIQPKFVQAIFEQGVLFEVQGKKKEAVAKYREALAISPNYVPALNNLAYAYANGLGSKQEALRLALTAYQLEPGNAGVMDTLGFALVQNKQAADGVKVLDKAVQLMPKNPTVQYHLALAYQGTGDKGKAVQALQQSLALGDFPEAGEAKRLLAQLSK